MTILALIRRELLSFFYTPLGWAVLTLFLLVQGYGFYLVVELLASPHAPHGAPMRLFFGGTFYYWLVMIAVSATVTMRLLAEERHSGTIEPLLTAPVGDAEVVLGKYVAALCFFAVLWLPTLGYVAILSRLASQTSVALGPVLCGYLGTLLVGAAFLAVGTLASALTRSQTVASLLTFAALVLLLLLGPMSLFTANPTLRAVIEHLNLFEHLDEFARGIVDSRRIALYLGMIIFCLAAATKALQRRRWS